VQELVAVAGSVAVHAAIVGIGFLIGANERGQREVIEQKIAIEVLAPPPRPELPPEPPQAERPEKPSPAPRVAKAPPPKAPPTPERPPETAKAPPPRVVGISLESTSESGSGPSFAAGNTRMGTTDTRAVTPGEVPKEPPPGSDPPLGENKVASRLPSAGVTYTPPQRKREGRKRYPETLKAQGIEGDVKVSVSIDVNGKVVAVKILSPSRYPEFNEAARAAALEEEYTPATRDGTPIPYSLPFTYKFRLDEE
jgi:protein TonB